MDRVIDDSAPSGNHHHHRRRQFPPGFDDAPPGFSPLSEAPPSCGGARKRQLSNTPIPDYYADDGGPGTGFAKLYVGRFPVTATEEEIRVPFGDFGNVIEVFFIMSKRNGEPLGCCFVKYATYEEADRAIKALNGRYTFPGAAHPIKVRYADSDKERPGNICQHKLYVSGLHRQATEGEIAEIFTPFGVVEEVFIIRGDMRQHRGCAFIQFSRREMAIAAINALNGIHIMWGCDMPLVVRFADPKKPRVGGPRATPNITDQVSGFPNNSHPNAPHSPNKRSKPHLACVSNSLDSGFHSSSSSPYALFLNEEPADSADCDWSEHICPDGYPYYFNCVTCESRWEKPEELALCEKQLLEHQHQHQHTPHLEPLSTAVAAQL